MVFSWTFLGHSTRAFIAPCLRPRKGLRIRGNKSTVKKVACDKGYKK